MTRSVEIYLWLGGIFLVSAWLAIVFFLKARILHITLEANWPGFNEQMRKSCRWFKRK